MRKYLGIRILLIIPTLFIVSLAGFYLSKNVPQDPAFSLLKMRGSHDEQIDFSSQNYKNTYAELKLNKPSFYFSIIPQHYPSNLNQYHHPVVRSFVQQNLKRGVSFHSIESFLKDFETLGLSVDMLSLDDLETQLSATPALLDKFNQLDKTVFFHLPKFVWFGLDNQYHTWIISLFSGNGGLSIADGRMAMSKVKTALSWTLSITLVELLISLSLGILIGVFLSKNPEGKLEHFLSQALYAIYSMPLFWLATILIIFFTTSEYGRLTNIFPSIGINIYPGKSTMTQIWNNFPKLILPIFCLCIHSLAYLSRFVRRGILTELDKDYILTAYSKGLNKNQVIWRHALPNALMPFITILGSVIPGAFASSLVLEVIFNIPGFGRLLYSSIILADWNVCFSILMIIALVTLISFLLVDILYAVFNPKIRYR